MKDDPETKPGYGIFDLTRVFRFFFGKRADKVVEWHDNITKEGSFAQRACIPGDRVAEAWGEQLREVAKQTPGSRDDVGAAVLGETPMQVVQPPFYEGPENDKERVECLIREGRNPDGTKI